jgi:septal ring factor EnvC (AmiA/AmiB activator)
VNLAAQHRAKSETIQGSAMAEQDRAMAMGEKARDIADLMDQLEADSAVRGRLASLSAPLLRPARPSEAGAPPDAETQTADIEKIPYRLPVAGSIISGLGEASESGARARGLTLATREDAQIVAPNGGRIVFAGPYRGYGNIVIIDHGGAWTTLITSVAVLDVRTGDNVSQGGPIGRAGNDRPNVTVELRHANKPVDIGSIVG